MSARRAAGAFAVAIVVAIALVAAQRRWWPTAEGAVVVYCAHDAVFAGNLLAEFTRRTGIAVAVRYDGEATKSLGLVERLIGEAAAPTCDVFWNNELLGTMDLAERGLLAPYQGAAWQRMPAGARDADGRWVAFAARLRVLLVERGLAADEAAVRARLASPGGDLARVAIAKPLYGTTLSHYCAWWRGLGPAGLQAWHADARARGMREVDGNGAVKDLVAAGACDIGFTDTDDAFAALDAGAAVAMLPARVLVDGREATIAVPNTVAVVAGGPHPAHARALVDFLASVEGELLLARSPSRQVPLGPVDDAALPDEVRRLRGWVGESLPLAELAPIRAPCLAWLKQAYAP
ncbi:MAG TPA: substrate-binding domain-containing protein [Planctomycetota bacterium]|nr:substrate-binding domain-containing protein [Planctomycetota bacterium]